MITRQWRKPWGDRHFIRGGGWEAGMWQSHSCWTDSGSHVFILTSPFLFLLGERTINMEQTWAGQERKLLLSAENHCCSHDNFQLKMLTLHYKIKFKLWKINKNKLLAAIKKTSTVEICQNHEKKISSQLKVFGFLKAIFDILLKEKHMFTESGCVLWKLPIFWRDGGVGNKKPKRCVGKSWEISQWPM